MITNAGCRRLIVVLTAVSVGCANGPSDGFNDSARSRSLAVTDPDANWQLGHPFDAIRVGIEGDDLAQSPCRANWGGGVHLGRTHRTSDVCDIGYGGAEIMVRPFETLVAAWADESGGAVPDNAYPFGTDGSGGPTLYPCRAFISGGDGYQLGKVRPGLGACFIPYGGKEVSVTQYQVLTTSIPLDISPPPSTNSNIRAVIGGYDGDGVRLSVCQAFFAGGFIPGKARDDLDACIVPWGGGEHYIFEYNVLTAGFRDPSRGSPVYQGGNESDGTPLGICEASFGHDLQPGKVVSNGNCNFGYGGTEMSFDQSSPYAVLAWPAI